MYDINYFIKKFEAIPSRLILNHYQGSKVGEGCAYGQCKSREGVQDGADTEEGKALERLFSMLSHNNNLSGDMCMPARVNNGEHHLYQQPTPKQRVLAALYDIAAMQSKKVEGGKIEPTFDPIIDKPTYPDFSPVTYEKIKELIPQQSNS